jgi:hypothetical protein
MKRRAFFYTSTILCLFAIFTIYQPVAQVSASDGIEFNGTFTLLSTDDGDLTCELHEECVWSLEFQVTNNGADSIVMASVSERLGAELEVDSTDAITHGKLYTWVRGASHKVFIWWFIKNLPAGETASLKLQISTDENPGGVQEYSQCGDCYLNSGAVLKYYSAHKKYVITAPRYRVPLPCESPPPSVGVPMLSDALGLLAGGLLFGAVLVRQRRK